MMPANWLLLLIITSCRIISPGSALIGSRAPQHKRGSGVGTHEGIALPTTNQQQQLQHPDDDDDMTTTTRRQQQQQQRRRQEEKDKSTMVVRCANVSNCTGEIQQALDADGISNIVIPPHHAPRTYARTPVQVDPLFVRKGNRTVTLSSGLELLAISMSPAYQRMDASLISIMHVSNVKIVASGAILRMHKLQYLPEYGYKKGEWRATLNIRMVSNLQVVGGTWRDAGGDGVFIESLTGPIVLNDVTTDGAWRNGLSVISANGLTVANCSFLNTNGTAPQCGIDVEPDHTNNMLRGIFFSNVSVLGNKRCGFSMAPYALRTSSIPIDVTIRGMIIVSAWPLPAWTMSPACGACLDR
jgi:hypothetical protein